MNKHVLITGTSSGIGEAIAEYFLEEDYIVFGLSRSSSNFEDNDNFIGINCDISEIDSVTEAFSEIAETTTKLDFIVNNAAVCEMYPLSETSSEEFKNHLEINTLGTFNILKSTESFLIPNESHIINILSVAAKYDFENVSAYGASKAAMKSLVTIVEKEWKKYGVKFSNLYPGAIDTPLWEKSGFDATAEKMLKVDEFIHVFHMIVSAPDNLMFTDLTFMHKDGILE